MVSIYFLEQLYKFVGELLFKIYLIRTSIEYDCYVIMSNLLVLVINFNNPVAEMLNVILVCLVGLIVFINL